MERTTTSPATAASALAAKYDFNSQRRVLDLGGGTGSFLLASLNRFEQLQATLHDLPPPSRLPPIAAWSEPRMRVGLRSRRGTSSRIRFPKVMMLCSSRISSIAFPQIRSSNFSAVSGDASKRGGERSATSRLRDQLVSLWRKRCNCSVEV